jgi:hypothetical protein
VVVVRLREVMHGWLGSEGGMVLLARLWVWGGRPHYQGYEGGGGCRVPGALKKVS